MITTGIDKQEISILIDSLLNEMFRPGANVSQEKKLEIKSTVLQIANEFISIIEVFNTSSNAYDNYVDKVCDKIDAFIIEFEKLLIGQNDKFIAGCVGAIWYGFFIDCQKELESYPTDKLFFEYGERKIQPLLISRLKK